MAPRPPAGGESRKPPSYSRFIFRAPSVPRSIAVLAVLTAAATALATGVSTLLSFAEDWAILLLGPGLLAAAVTPAIARAFGGRLSLQRSVLLVVTTTGLSIPVLLLWRVIAVLAPPVAALGAVPLLLLIQGPTLWFRHLSLFGISAPSHPRSIGASAIHPVLSLLVLFAWYGPSPGTLAAAGLILVAAFLCCALLLRAADRPLRREFGVSGVSLIRPLLDHINLRDPGATESLEEFFAGFAKPANLEVATVRFSRAGVPYASLVLPTVHPGPFGALGGSDLPRKLSDQLAPIGGMILVPHTPCNHDLDLPTGREVARVGAAAATLLRAAPLAGRRESGPLVSPHPGSLARAQMVGGCALVLVTQAPAPTDDIDYAVADRIARGLSEGIGGRIVLIDAHNSYLEDQGDITFGTPTADQLAADARAALASARSSSGPVPLAVGVARRQGYSTGRHGIGPMGITALVIRAGPSTTAYVLVDGNNLVQGHRARILEDLRGVVDTAEILTTDNHVVHEVDGSINPVGDRFPADRLAADVRETVQTALQDLAPAEVDFGHALIPEVPVLGPDWTARLLTSLGDTVSMFGHAFLMTFLLLLASSALILVVAH